MKLCFYYWSYFLTYQAIFAFFNHHNPEGIQIEHGFCDRGCECTTIRASTTVDCRKKGFESLPGFTQLSTNVTEVILKENKIHSIPKHTFLSAPSLKELDLSQNSLSSLDDYAFVALKELLVLHLSHNQIATLSSGALKGLKKLEMLELGHNKLTSLPENFFASTPYLIELHLQYNGFKKLDEQSFRYLPLLEKLDLQNNGLVTLTSNLFVYTPQLQLLSLAENNFQHVPKEAFRPTRMLRSLDLSGNKFEVLESQSFSTLSNLSFLYLNNLNKLQRIEKDAFVNMTNLKLLSCNYNRNLRFIHPEAFGHNGTSSNLKKYPPSEHLFLAHNGLRSLQEPQELNVFMHLVSVDFKGNPWRCDCHLRWMTHLKKEISSTARCETPLIHHGRSIDSMEESEFVCNDSWAFSTIVIMLTSAVAFLVCATFAFAVVCYKTPVGQRVRAKCQFSYSKVNARRECVDLEWDPTADM